MMPGQNRRVSQLGDGVAWDHVAGGSSPSSPTTNYTGTGEGKKVKYAPEVIATKLAPNQQDKVRFLTGVPKDELEDQKASKTKGKY